MLRRITLLFLIIITITACNTARSLEPAIAQQRMVDSWMMDQHTIWEIDWPAAPIGGVLVVESWRSGNRFRYEILESQAVALIGQTLVFDGKQVWQYNRLDPPEAFSPTPPTLSPVTDAFALIDQLTGTTPTSVTEEASRANFIPTTKIVATYSNGDRLTLWRNSESGLPVRIEFEINGQQAMLNARSSEPLSEPPEELFSVGEWTKND